jgi:hypothetical protein
LTAGILDNNARIARCRTRVDNKAVGGRTVAGKEGIQANTAAPARVVVDRQGLVARQQRRVADGRGKVDYARVVEKVVDVRAPGHFPGAVDQLQARYRSGTCLECAFKRRAILQNDSSVAGANVADDRAGVEIDIGRGLSTMDKIALYPAAACHRHVVRGTRRDTEQADIAGNGAPGQGQGAAFGAEQADSQVVDVGYVDWRSRIRDPLRKVREAGGYFAVCRIHGAVGQ